MSFLITVPTPTFECEKSMSMDRNKTAAAIRIKEYFFIGTAIHLTFFKTAAKTMFETSPLLGLFYLLCIDLYLCKEYILAG